MKKKKTVKDVKPNPCEWTLEERVNLNRTVALLVVTLEAVNERIDIMEDRLQELEKRFSTRMMVTYNN